MTEQLKDLEDGTVWYFEDAEMENSTKHEGRVEIRPNWVVLKGLAITSWVPRERVEQVHES
jgi:hypothetical protein